jgi:hypothetical protein
MTKKRNEDFIPGTAKHRRTERDYLSVLLDEVTFDDWRDVVGAALRAAKEGDPAARTWLSHYLMGRPEGKAPTPLTVVVQQLSGLDPVVDRLAGPVISRELYSIDDASDEWQNEIKALIATQLAEKVRDDGTNRS